VPHGISLGKKQGAALGRDSWLAANEAQYQMPIQVNL